MSGSVVDMGDAAIPNATVKVYLAGGKEPVASTTTNALGNFVFTALLAETYDVGVEISGFTPYIYRLAKVSPTLDTALPPFKLQVQGVSQIVEVIADAQGVRKVTSDITNTLSTSQIQNLPVLGRQVYNLIETQPGVTMSSNTTTVNGLKSSYSNVTMDGINIQDNFIRTNDLNYAPYRPTIDQIAEISVNTSNGNAALGGGSSHIVMSTRSGGNDYHGSVYWFNRNDALSSNDWFNNRDEVAKPRLNLNQPGVALGGPVALSPNMVFRDKLLFYSNYEWYRNKQATSLTRTTLSDAAKQGVFTYVDTTNQTRTANVLTLRGVGINPTIKAMLDQLPASNSPGVGDGLNTLGYRFNASDNEFRDQFVQKLDYYITSKHSLTGTYNYIDNPTQRADLGAFFTQQPPVSNTLVNRLMSLALRSSLTPTLTNELRGGFARNSGTFDIANDYPSAIVGGLLFSSPVNTYMANGRDTNTYQIQDNLNWIHRGHSVSFGYQYQGVYSSPFTDAGIIPTYTLGLSTANTTGLAAAELPGIRAADLTRANSLYANLAGIISSAAQTFNVTSMTSGFVPRATNLRELNYKTHSLYVQDAWKLLPRLTVNLGVRYEYWTPLDEKNGLFLAPVLDGDNFGAVRSALANPNTVLDFIGGDSGRPFYKADKNNFAPNVGFAWDPFGQGKTAIRGGYSVSYVNDNLMTTARNNVNTSSGLTSSVTLPNLVANLASPPAVTPPAYKVPRTLADNYALSTASATGIPDPNLGTPWVQQWNFSIEQEVFGVLLAGRYIGNRGSDLMRALDYNQVLYNASGFLADFKRAQSNGALAQAATGIYNPAYNAALPGSQQLTVFPLLGSGGLLTNTATVQPLIRNGEVAELANIYQTNRLNGSVNFYANPNIQGGNTVINGGRSTYNGVQLEATKRTRNGFTGQFSYVYGKSLSNASGDGQTNFEPLLDINNPSLESARSPYDTRHAFKANAVYELPFGIGKRWSSGRLLNYLVGGWSVSGVWSHISGSPFSILSGRGTLNRGARSLATNTASIAPGTSFETLSDLTSGVFQSNGILYFVSPTLLNADGRGTNQPLVGSYAGQVFYNPDAGTVGNLQRRMFSGPWQQAFDMTVRKRFAFDDSRSLDIQFDMFNVLNHPTFYVPPSTAGDFGTQSVFNVNNTFFGQIDSMNYAPRQIQIGAYFRF